MEKVLKQKLGYSWRLLFTGIGFFLFGIGGLLLTIFVFPLINLCYISTFKRQKRARRVIQKSFKCFVAYMQLFGIFNFDLEQAERDLISQSGKIVIANHPTLIDVVVLISILPQADCVVKRNLWNNFFLKGAVTAAGYIKNSGDIQGLIKDCKKSLDHGYCLIIFPEGTRTSPGKMPELKRGASNIAIRCAGDFVPVVINCEPTTLSKGDPWYRIPEHTAQFSLRVGDVIETARYREPYERHSLSARKLNGLLNEYYYEKLFPYA